MLSLDRSVRRGRAFTAKNKANTISERMDGILICKFSTELGLMLLWVDRTVIDLIWKQLNTNENLYHNGGGLDFSHSVKAVSTIWTSGYAWFRFQMLASTFLTFHGSDISNDKQVRYLDKDIILFNDK